MLNPLKAFFGIVFLNFAVYGVAILFSISKDDVNAYGIYFTSMPMDNIVDGFEASLGLFVALLFIGTASFYLNKKWVRAKIRLRAAADESELMGRGSDYKKKKIIFLVKFGLVVVLSLNVMHFFSMDWHVLWLNYDYQAIKTPDDVGIDDWFFRIYHFALRVLGIIFAVAVSYFYVKKERVALLLAGFSFLYFLLIELVSNSRLAPIYMVVAFLGYFYFKGRVKLWKVVLAFLATYFLYIRVLYGRNYDSQGLSVLLEAFDDIDFFQIYMAYGLIANLAEGFVNFANSVLLHASFAPSYKLLSFSPFPSFVDGFNQLLDVEEVRVNAFVPMGSFGEAYHFGFVFFLLYLAIIFWSLVMSHRVYAAGSRFFGLLIAVVFAWNFMYSFGYPLRNVVRVYEYLIIASIFYLRSNDRYLRKVARLMGQRENLTMQSAAMKKGLM